MENPTAENVSKVSFATFAKTFAFFALKT